MKKVMLLLNLLLLVACDIHQWPDKTDYVKLHLSLNYETGMREWENIYTNTKVIEQGFGKEYDNHLSDGKIRYIIRTYPLSAKKHSADNYVQEFVFTKDISLGYNHEVLLDVLPGDYSIMLWSDLIKADGDTHFYDASDFSGIALQGRYVADSDYRDAFKGVNSISLVADIVERLPDTLAISMQRPLAKFEFITKDAIDFIKKEAERTASEESGQHSYDAHSRAINIEDYKVVFYYVGFMPNIYSIHSDKPVDSSLGVMFESNLRKLNESEVTMGFDYQFARSDGSSVTVQFGVYDSNGYELIISKPITLPIKRSHHTKIYGNFLTDESANGTFINPNYGGDHNLIF